MEANNKIVVLIPCRNEKTRIGDVVHSIKRVLPEADTIVIDDKSSDNSNMEAKSAGAIVLSHPVHLGYGAALETGYLFAIKYDYKFILQMDGDGQHIAEDLTILLESLKEGKADLIIGSRYKKNNKFTTSTIKIIGQKLFQTIIFIITGQSFTDPTSGFQALNRKAATFLSSGVFPCDYPDTDVLLMSHLAGLRITEVPVNMKPRVSGKSMHSGFSPLYYGIKMFLSIFIVLLNYKTWRNWDNNL